MQGNPRRLGWDLGSRSEPKLSEEVTAPLADPGRSLQLNSDSLPGSLWCFQTGSGRNELRERERFEGGDVIGGVSPTDERTGGREVGFLVRLEMCLRQ